MLELLRIKNLALIDDLELEFVPGLNVLTGETGAGKSFILKAVNFLTGERLPADIVRPGADKAVVEALFAGDQGEHVLRRELSAETGRSRLFINETLSSLEAIEALRPRLLMHASQHGQQRLLSAAYQAQVVDAFCQNLEPLADKDRWLARLRDVAARRAALDQRLEKLAAQREFLEFQRQEIAKVDPQPGEEEELLARREELRGLAAARKSLDAVAELLSGNGDTGLLEAAGRLCRELKALARTLPELEADAEQCAGMNAYLGELERTLRRLRPGAALADGNHRTVEGVEARLYALAQLRRKLKRELADIVALRGEIDANLSFLDAAELDRKALAREEAEARAGAAAALERLQAERRKAASLLIESMQAELRELGFSEHVRLAVSFDAREVFPGIHEQVGRILWIPNPGQPPQPLDRIASGGELSRFLLALTRLLARSEQPTLVFDEVDAGIGGLTLMRVAERLKELSSRQQLLLITHWPQLAAKADRHFQVVKDIRDGQTTTRCVRLRGPDIAKELTRMAGGGPEAQALALGLLGGDPAKPASSGPG